LERIDMERTWKPTTAGILCIIAGIIGVVPGIVVAALVGSMFSIGLFFVIGAPSIILGVIAIVGGIYALRRRIWKLALAGSICAFVVPVIVVTSGMIIIAAGLSEGSPLTIPEILASIWYLIVGFGIPGILAIIFVIRGKREFR
jgi:hypothetical protein